MAGRLDDPGREMPKSELGRLTGLNRQTVTNVECGKDRVTGELGHLPSLVKMLRIFGVEITDPTLPSAEDVRAAVSRARVEHAAQKGAA